MINELYILALYNCYVNDIVLGETKLDIYS